MKLTREQWMIATAMSGAINALNAPFCCEPDQAGGKDGPVEVSRDPAYIDNVAREIARDCGRMAIEDVIQVLKRAIEIGPPAKEG